MHARMYADMLAWRGALIIMLLVAVPYAIHLMRQKDEEQQEETEENNPGGAAD